MHDSMYNRLPSFEVAPGFSQRVQQTKFAVCVLAGHADVSLVLDYFGQTTSI